MSLRASGAGAYCSSAFWVTFKHFLNTYVDDIRYAGRKRRGAAAQISAVLGARPLARRSRFISPDEK